MRYIDSLSLARVARDGAIAGKLPQLRYLLDPNRPACQGTEPL